MRPVRIRVLLVTLALVAAGLIWSRRALPGGGLGREVASVPRAAFPASAGRAASAGMHAAAPSPREEAAAAARFSRQLIFERFGYAHGWDGPVPAGLAPFRDWAKRYLAAPAATRAVLEAEGVTLARARRTVMRDLIIQKPQRALALTVPATVRQALPAAVVAELETRVAGSGEFSLNAAHPAPETPYLRPEPERRLALINGVSYRAHVYGRREPQETKLDASLHGIALDRHLALHESPLRVLDPGEIPAASVAPRCPVTGLPVEPPRPGSGVNLGEPDVVEAHGRLFRLSNAGAPALDSFAQRMESAEAAPVPQVALLAREPEPAIPDSEADVATPYTIGLKQVLVIRVDFADVPGEAVSIAFAQGVMDNGARPHLENFSYGQTNLVTTISSQVYRMPQLAVTYALADNATGLHSDARALAGADFTVASFDRVIVVYPHIGPSRIPGSQIDFGGTANVRGPYLQINGTSSFNPTTLAHEIGHTYGLRHANLWRVADGDTLSATATTLEYGDPFDMMGSHTVTGVTRDDRHHFNLWAKNRLGWLPDSAVLTATTTGTHRIFRFDSMVAPLDQPQALRVFRDGTRWYWIGLRQNFATGFPEANGAYLLWAFSNLQQTQLLDATNPGFTATDAVLPVGTALADPLFGLAIKPVNRGGLEPGQWLDVEVTRPARQPNVVAIWGREGASNFVANTGAASSPAPETYGPMGLVNVKAIAAGDQHAIALKTDGTVVAWGDHTLGQVTVPEGLAGVVLVAAGGDVSGAVRGDGTVELWGDATFGQTTPPAGLANVRQLAIGYTHVLALKHDGTVVAWGTNTAGQMNVPLTLQNVVMIAAGDRTSNALHADGTVTRWGANFSVPLPTGLSGVTAISANGAHTLALKSDGTVVAWGNNANTQSIVPDGLTNVVAVAAGGFHSMALKADGTIVNWGSNTSGQSNMPAGIPRAHALGASTRGCFALVGEPFFVVAQPSSQTVGAGGPVALSTGAALNPGNPVPTFQWQRNGTSVAGATGATLNIGNVQPADTGIYAALVSSGAASSTDPAVVGLSSTSKVIGTGTEVGTDILHPMGNTYDQVLLQGAAATITADPGQVTRISFVDLNDDIVQVEFSGPGALSLVLDAVTGPATPVKYNQPTVGYMKGHAGIVITGANENTHASVFTVGRGNAVNQTLFLDGVDYDGTADIAYVAILSANGKFGGLRTANASYFNTKGFTGIYAPGVQFDGPVFVGDIGAADAASGLLMLGAASDTRITGGDLLQANGRAVRVSGLTQLRFVDGSTSHGTLLPAQANRARLEQDLADVTAQIVVNP